MLNSRAKYSNSSLADLYDPLTMPPDLDKAHHALDKVVDRCYRSQSFTSDMQRIAYLFERYHKYTAPLALLLPITLYRTRMTRIARIGADTN